MLGASLTARSYGRVLGANDRIALAQFGCGSRSQGHFHMAAHGISSLRDQYEDSLLTLMAIVAVVLLIACANIANFLLARAMARQREYATRLALGSSRGRIVRQSVAEALLLSLTGGLLGLAIAFVATRALLAFVTQDAAYTPLEARPDGVILLFTLGVSTVAGLLFGFVPALHPRNCGGHRNIGVGAGTSSSIGRPRGGPALRVMAPTFWSVKQSTRSGYCRKPNRPLQQQPS